MRYALFKFITEAEWEAVASVAILGVVLLAAAYFFNRWRKKAGESDSSVLELLFGIGSVLLAVGGATLISVVVVDVLVALSALGP